MAAPMARSVFLRIRRVSYLQKRWMASHSRNILKLHERGLFQNVYPETSSAELLKLLKGDSQCIYCGFDPTADSLHIGNLVALMALMQCQRAGHQAVVLIGEATAQIGDPSGRTTERKKVQSVVTQKNSQLLTEQMQQIFNNHEEGIQKKDIKFKPVM